MPKRQHHKRPFLMLEVLIAFALIIFCIAPLTIPHFAILKEQKASINNMRINHAVSNIYVAILEKMHKMEVPLNDIENKTVFPVDFQELKEIQGYSATYQFSIIKLNIRKTDGFTTYLVNLQLNFVPTFKGKPYTYDYEIFFATKKDLNANLPPDIEEDDEEYETDT
jgi:hypothetical protein